MKGGCARCGKAHPLHKHRHIYRTCRVFLPTIDAVSHRQLRADLAKATPTHAQITAAVKAFFRRWRSS